MPRLKPSELTLACSTAYQDARTGRARTLGGVDAVRRLRKQGKFPLPYGQLSDYALKKIQTAAAEGARRRLVEQAIRHYRQGEPIGTLYPQWVLDAVFAEI